jgi:hypothetical protein
MCAVVACFGSLALNVTGETKENFQDPQSLGPVSKQEFYQCNVRFGTNLDLNSLWN